MLSHRPWKSVSRLQPHWLKSPRPFQFCFKINNIILEYVSTLENIHSYSRQIKVRLKVKCLIKIPVHGEETMYICTDMARNTHTSDRLTRQFPFLSSRPKNISDTRIKDSASWKIRFFEIKIIKKNINICEGQCSPVNLYIHVTFLTILNRSIKVSRVLERRLDLVCGQK